MLFANVDASLAISPRTPRCPEGHCCLTWTPTPTAVLPLLGALSFTDLRGGHTGYLPLPSPLPRLSCLARFEPCQLTGSQTGFSSSHIQAYEVAKSAYGFLTKSPFLSGNRKPPVRWGTRLISGGQQVSCTSP